MKKDITRDYITETFRAYARMGKPPLQTLEKIVNKEKSPLVMDAIAVSKTMQQLHANGDYEIYNAVAAVYFTDPGKALRRNDISARVAQYAHNCPVDTRTVYRWLKKARLMCAAERGLKI